jgi:hypothetical protein
MQGVGSWNVKGVGFLRLNKNKGAEGGQGAAESDAGAQGAGGVRVVMRKIGNLELILNSRLFAGMACKKGCVCVLFCFVLGACASPLTEGWKRAFYLAFLIEFVGADFHTHVRLVCAHVRVRACVFAEGRKRSSSLACAKKAW